MPKLKTEAWILLSKLLTKLLGGQGGRRFTVLIAILPLRVVWKFASTAANHCDGVATATAGRLQARLLVTTAAIRLRFGDFARKETVTEVP